MFISIPNRKCLALTDPEKTVTQIFNLIVICKTGAENKSNELESHSGITITHYRYIYTEFQGPIFNIS